MMIFVRLQKPQIFRDHCEVSVPTRFVGIIVGPPSAEMRVVDIGKALGTLMSDQVSFCRNKRAERIWTFFFDITDFSTGGLQSCISSPNR